MPVCTDLLVLNPAHPLRVAHGHKLALIDFGLVAPVSESNRAALMAAIVHLRHRQWHALVDDLIDLHFLQADEDNAAAAKPTRTEKYNSIRSSSKQVFFKQRNQTAKVLERILEPYVFQGGGLGSFTAGEDRVNWGTVLRELGKAIVEIPFKIPPEFALIARAVGCLEGIALTADPNFRMVLEAYPLVAARVVESSRSTETCKSNDSLTTQHDVLSRLLLSGKSSNGRARMQPKALFDMLREAAEAPSYTGTGYDTPVPASDSTFYSSESNHSFPLHSTTGVSDLEAVLLLLKSDSAAGTAARRVVKEALECVVDLWVRRSLRTFLTAASHPTPLAFPQQSLLAIFGSSFQDAHVRRHSSGYDFSPLLRGPSMEISAGLSNAASALDAFALMLGGGRPTLPPLLPQALVAKLLEKPTRESNEKEGLPRLQIDEELYLEEALSLIRRLAVDHLNLLRETKHRQHHDTERLQTLRASVGGSNAIVEDRLDDGVLMAAISEHFGDIVDLSGIIAEFPQGKGDPARLLEFLPDGKSTTDPLRHAMRQFFQRGATASIATELTLFVMQSASENTQRRLLSIAFQK